MACAHCNLHKGTNLTGIDPKSGDIVLLFNPRLLRWREHFQMDGVLVVGLTATGRATATLLKMNAAERVELRALLVQGQ